MITLRLPARVFLCLAPIDMRKSFDGLAAVVSSTMWYRNSSMLNIIWM